MCSVCSSPPHNSETWPWAGEDVSNNDVQTSFDTSVSRPSTILVSQGYITNSSYWRCTCESCVGHPIDGMDQAKHCYPKSESMKSKEFNSWSRPRLGATTIIAHGHAVVVGLSPDHVPASGSRTMELLAYMLRKPLEYVHWPQVFLHMQADNCTKELNTKHPCGCLEPSLLNTD